jgi:two-component system chemotaxis response regulator CheB
LNRSRKLEAMHPEDRTPVGAGTIYVAPNDRHLLLEDGLVRVVRGPRVNRSRPAIDVLFVSASRTYRERTVGVILSGLLDDGALGLAAIKARGGVAIVQDPDEAMFASMPRNAIARGGGVDYILGAEHIAPLLVTLARSPTGVRKEAASMTTDDGEGLIARDFAAQEQGRRDRQPSIFTCPECGGVLWEIEDGALLQYRCHVGHEYSMESMVDGHAETVERALWSAVRILEENASLSRRMEQRFTQDGYARSAQRYAERAEEAERQAHALRMLLESTAFNGPIEPDVDEMTTRPSG